MTDSPNMGIRARVDALRADTTHGASWLARMALAAAGESARESQARTVFAARLELRRTAALLAATQPEMAALETWLDRLVSAADDAAGARSARDFLERVASLADE